MKRLINFAVTIIIMISIISTSCTDQVKETEKPVKIENTLQSVSYFQDTVGYDPQFLLEVFTSYNKAIDEIGYPDAGYKIWLIQEDTTDIRFMVEGFWPSQEVYDEIHDHQLYIKAGESDDNNLDGLVWIEYLRFRKIE